MKQSNFDKPYNVKDLCLLFEKSRQSYYKSLNNLVVSEGFAEEIIIDNVKKIRETMPKCGTKKIYCMLKQNQSETFHIGRDALFELLRKNKMLIRQRKKKVVTTQSHHWLNKFDNLIKKLEVNRPNQVWVSDITYVRYSNGFAYLFLITDLKTRRIMGYKLSNTLESKHAIDALEMANNSANMDLNGLIHHSDHGVQYCCYDYIEMIESLGAVSSMSEKGNPYENAVAERVNGIIKNEWLDDDNFDTFKQVEKRVKEVIDTYNSKRLHMSLNFRTPDEVYYEFFN